MPRSNFLHSFIGYQDFPFHLLTTCIFMWFHSLSFPPCLSQISYAHLVSISLAPPMCLSSDFLNFLCIHWVSISMFSWLSFVCSVIFNTVLMRPYGRYLAILNTPFMLRCGSSRAISNTLLRLCCGSSLAILNMLRATNRRSSAFSTKTVLDCLR